MSNSVKIFFGILGAMILAYGIKFKIDNVQFVNNAIKTEATITHLSTSEDSEGATIHTVIVNYFANGIECSGMLDGYNENMHVGGKVEVYYSMKNPKKFITVTYGERGYILMAVGGIFLLIGLSAIISNKKTHEENTR